jgi:tetratricopeptide (TPR) repeat protein
LAAQRAVEEAIEARLAEEFQRRQAAQVSALLDQVEAARGERRYDDALELVGTARVLAPQDDRLIELEAACHRDQARQLEKQGAFAEAALAYRDVLAVRPGDSAAAAGEARCRSLSDRSAARSQEIGERFALAFDAFSAEDFATARRGFAEILELSPGDSEAARMLERTEAAILRRTATHLQLAERLLHDGVLEEAENLTTKTRRLDPNARGLEALAKRIEAAQRERVASSTANRGTNTTAQTRAARAGSQERLEEIEDLYQRGLTALQDGRGRDAVRYWELVWSFDPDYERVREHLRREYTTRGMELFARGNLNDAIQQWQNALRVDPSDPRALAYLSRAQEQLARTRQILGEGD